MGLAQNKILKNMPLSDKEKKLSTYARRHGTDKIDHHDYIKHYAKNLPDTCSSLLEIGALKGASGKMWESFYGFDNLDLYLLDLYKDPENVSPRWVRNQGWTPLIGDQSDITFLSSIKRQFEVIVDDGSHNAHHQIISFKALFLNNLVPEGLYVIEDLACNKDPFYYGGDVKSYADTPLAMLKEFTQTGTLVNPYFNEGEAQVFRSLIDRVLIYDEEIAFITRKP